MTISATFIELQRQIADELGDHTDLLSPLPDSGLDVSPVKLAIRSAIAKWESTPFWFNEVYDYDTPLFTTAAGQEFYPSGSIAAIDTSPYITSLHMLYAGNRMPITERSWDYIEEISGSPSGRGLPGDWAYFGGQIRLYPIPNGAYLVRAVRTRRFDPLAADTDTNVWTTHAYDLIRSEAKLILARETLHDPDLAAECEIAIHGNPATGNPGYLFMLKAETARRSVTRIKPTQF